SFPTRMAGPTLPALFALFSPAEAPAHEIVPADQVPEPYRGLLVHEHHMTVTVEKHHGGLVDVRILARRQTGDYYARKILLALQGGGRVVQLGIARVTLRYCRPAARGEFLAGQPPLGRILITHTVLRRIEPTAYLGVTPGPAMMKWFGLDSPRTTYGRLGIIHCDERPAIELLEIVTPE